MNHREHICKCQLPACICPNNWARCKFCGEEITWVKTDLGRSMPIDGHLKAYEWDSTYQRSHQRTCKNPPERKPNPVRPKQTNSKPRKPINPKQGNIFADLALAELRGLRTNQIHGGLNQ